jgi:hypothetical protein
MATKVILSKSGAAKLETRLKSDVDSEITARYDINEGAPVISVYWGERRMASIQRSGKELLICASSFPFLDNQLYDKQIRLNAVLVKLAEEFSAVFRESSPFAM